MRGVFVRVFLILVFPSTCSSLSPELTEFWNEFWSISCEFSSSLVSRTGRSVHPTLNYDDPEELFDYLYPLADVRLEDVVAEEVRSSSHSLSTWIDDLVMLIHSECIPDPVLSPQPQYDLQDKEYRRNDSRSSQLLRDGRQLDASLFLQEDDDDHSEEIEIESEGDEAEVEVAEGANATVVAAAAAVVIPPPKEKKVIADANTFFTQYGGDIEYFFPLLSFGIPFDGEITFLGFHGFKGLFPYR